MSSNNHLKPTLFQPPLVGGIAPNRESKITRIYAHRGANKEAAENTRTAFERALHYPIDGIETDIQLTRDGVPVLWHDDDFAKLGHADKRVDDFDFAQLQTLNFAAHFEGAEKVSAMTLQDFVTAYHARCDLLLEIKRYSNESQVQQHSKVRQTLSIAQAVNSERIMASSFDLDSLLYAQQIAPNFPLVFNLEPEHNVAFAIQALQQQPFLQGLCVHIATLDAAMMAAVRQRGKSIAVYTCNTDEQIDRALHLGVDVLISDFPQRALHRRA
ncbi:MAG: glycerophosphodiester phosphodiesterase [Sideroxydans sp.]|nr:glycerophosphodiester phosphodiesterase [Sideroxydans sp.]